MNITLSPIRGLQDCPMTTISVAGEVITIDGTDYDLSGVAEGGEITFPDTPIIGPVTRTGGVIHCTVLAVLDQTTANNQPTDPAHWVVTGASGSVTIPAVAA